MRRFIPLLGAAVVAAIQVACSAADSGSLAPPTAPDLARAADARRFEIHDACDPATFDAVLGEGACVRAGGMKFDQFIDQLTKHQSVGAWSFSPPNRDIRLGQSFVALNQGGEAHTFTEVEEFGGGRVPLLNALSGNPVEAEECKQAEDIPPGGRFDDTPDEAGVEKYQCCIHPWMRATVTVRGS